MQSDDPSISEQRKEEIRKQVQAKSRARHLQAIEDAKNTEAN
jgi:hypothetical protein